MAPLVSTPDTSCATCPRSRPPIVDGVTNGLALLALLLVAQKVVQVIRQKRSRHALLSLQAQAVNTSLPPSTASSDTTPASGGHGSVQVVQTLEGPLLTSTSTSSQWNRVLTEGDLLRLVHEQRLLVGLSIYEQGKNSGGKGNISNNDNSSIGVSPSRSASNGETPRDHTLKCPSPIVSPPPPPITLSEMVETRSLSRRSSYHDDSSPENDPASADENYPFLHHQNPLDYMSIEIPSSSSQPSSQPLLSDTSAPHVRPMTHTTPSIHPIPPSPPSPTTLPRRRSYSRTVSLLDGQLPTTQAIPTPATSRPSMDLLSLLSHSAPASQTQGHLGEVASPLTKCPTQSQLPVNSTVPARALAHQRGHSTSDAYRKSVQVQGEIVSVMDLQGRGWKRHTRVYGNPTRPTHTDTFQQ